MILTKTKIGSKKIGTRRLAFPIATESVIAASSPGPPAGAGADVIDLVFENLTTISLTFEADPVATGIISQTFAAFQNDDKILELTCTTNGDISADTFEFELVDKNRNLAMRKTMASGITISDVGSSSTPGVVQVSLVDALEIASGAYTWQFRRTNTGREDTLAKGSLPLARSYRDAT